MVGGERGEDEREGRRGRRRGGGVSMTRTIKSESRSGQLRVRELEKGGRGTLCGRLGLDLAGGGSYRARGFSRHG